MATAHLTPEALKKFRSKTLGAREFLSASEHLQDCDSCARLLRESWGSGPLVPGLASEVEHLTYEQIATVLDRSATPAERQWVDDHSRVCPPCARQLRELQELDALLSRPAPAAAAAHRDNPQEPARAAAARDWGFWGWVNGALAAALALLLVVGATLARRSESPSAAASASGPLSNVHLDETSVLAGLVIAVGLVFVLLLVMSRRRQHKERRRQP